MSEIPVVGTRHMTDAETRVRRQPRALEILRDQEPELADYAAEKLVNIQRALDELCAHREETRLVYHRFETLLLICLDAQRRAHLDRAAVVANTGAVRNASIALQVRNAPLTPVTCRSDSSPL